MKPNQIGDVPLADFCAITEKSAATIFSLMQQGKFPSDRTDLCDDETEKKKRRRYNGHDLLAFNCAEYLSDLMKISFTDASKFVRESACAQIYLDNLHDLETANDLWFVAIFSSVKVKSPDTGKWLPIITASAKVRPTWKVRNYVGQESTIGLHIFRLRDAYERAQDFAAGAGFTLDGWNLCKKED